MNAVEWAERINNRAKGLELSTVEAIRAGADGVVIAYVNRDNQVVFLGIIDDEADIKTGKRYRLSPRGEVLYDDENCGLYTREEIMDMPLVSVNNLTEWRGGAEWEIETGLPHWHFIITDENGAWCKGIVFEWKTAYPEPVLLAGSVKVAQLNNPDRPESMVLVPKNIDAREYFAGQALVGMLASEVENCMYGAEGVAKRAYAIADAMIKERKKA